MCAHADTGSTDEDGKGAEETRHVIFIAYPILVRVQALNADVQCVLLCQVGIIQECIIGKVHELSHAISLRSLPVCGKDQNLNGESLLKAVISLSFARNQETIQAGTGCNSRFAALRTSSGQMSCCLQKV